MLFEKLCYIKTNINFRNSGTDPSKVLGQGLYFIPYASCTKFLSKILATLNTLKYEKVYNTTVSYLVSCHVIARPATMKR